MATLDQVFQQEKAWIADCEDVDALIDKIGDWRDSAREAESNGQMLLRMRAGDLIELAQRRVVGLQARQIRAEKVSKAPARPAANDRVSQRAPEPVRAMPTVAAVHRQLPPAPPVTPAREARPVVLGSPPVAEVGQARRTAEAEASRAAAEKAKADARLAAAAADRAELQNALLRAQVEAARRAVAPAVQAPHPPADGVGSQPPQPVSPAAARVRPPVVARAPEPRPVVTPPSPARPAAAASPPRPVAAKSTAAKPAPTKPTPIDGYTEADRVALASVGRWPPTPPERRGAFWSRDDDWPAEWTLTGGELGRFRGEVNLTRAVLAAQLGVPSVVVKDAELKPREKLAPAMQIAARRAMDLEQARRDEAREQRRARAEQAAAPVLKVEVRDGVGTGPAAAPVPGATAAAFTGADLARLRAQRGLTQKEMADLLGVEQGTVSKGEAKGNAALGPALQEAMALVCGPRESPLFRR